ncbi:MAG: hypothetical protein M3328_11895 [Chloroflexota bacterium]|nr:hypothetical protein [Chloroflexota bacterium]
MLFSPFITLKYKVSQHFGLPTRTKAKLYNAPEEGNAPPDELSYEDALLDAQLRLFMRAEFDGVEPPAWQYAQVERLISQDKETDGSLILPSLPSSTPFLPALTSDLPASPFRVSRPSGRFYRLLMGTASSRLLPGGIALALMMMVLGANVSQLLRGEFSVLYGGANPTPVADGTGWDATGVSAQPPHTASGNPTVGQPSIRPEIYIYDPAEVRMPKRPDASALSTHRDTLPMPSQELRPE